MHYSRVKSIQKYLSALEIKLLDECTKVTTETVKMMFYVSVLCSRTLLFLQNWAQVTERYLVLVCEVDTHLSLSVSVSVIRYMNSTSTHQLQCTMLQANKNY